MLSCQVTKFIASRLKTKQKHKTPEKQLDLSLAQRMLLHSPVFVSKMRITEREGTRMGTLMLI